VTPLNLNEVINTDHWSGTEYDILLLSFREDKLTSIDGQLPSQNDPPVRRCGKCDWELTLLGNLPAVAMYAAARVFRCYVCNNVVSEEC
jgi:hypothetical protein